MAAFFGPKFRRRQRITLISAIAETDKPSLLNLIPWDLTWLLSLIPSPCANLLFCFVKVTVRFSKFMLHYWFKSINCPSLQWEKPVKVIRILDQLKKNVLSAFSTSQFLHNCARFEPNLLSIIFWTNPQIIQHSCDDEKNVYYFVTGRVKSPPFTGRTYEEVFNDFERSLQITVAFLMSDVDGAFDELTWTLYKKLELSQKFCFHEEERHSHG